MQTVGGFCLASFIFQTCQVPSLESNTFLILCSKVDGKALVIFPMSFLLFNLIYWSHYIVGGMDFLQEEGAD